MFFFYFTVIFDIEIPGSYNRKWQGRVEGEEEKKILRSLDLETIVGDGGRVVQEWRGNLLTMETQNSKTF